MDTSEQTAPASCGRCEIILGARLFQDHPVGQLVHPSPPIYFMQALTLGITPTNATRLRAKKSSLGQHGRLRPKKVADYSRSAGPMKIGNPDSNSSMIKINGRDFLGRFRGCDS